MNSKPDYLRKTKEIRIRCTEKEYRYISDQASKNHSSISQYLLNEKTPRNKQRALYRKQIPQYMNLQEMINKMTEYLKVNEQHDLELDEILKGLEEVNDVLWEN